MNRQFLEHLYVAFNERRFDDLLALMHTDVEWENGMQGGFIYGREAVCEYWNKQFEFITSHLDPLKFETDEAGREMVGVHLAVSDLKGSVLLDKTVKHIFTFKDGLIVKFEIADTMPFLQSEGLGDISDKFDSRMQDAEVG
jgi:ketosteroid isomerase-like protein